MTNDAAIRDMRRLMTRIALEVGGLLNTVMDDDERDELHGHFEKTLNAELYAGSVNRAAVAPFLALLPTPRRTADVVDLFSRKVGSS